MNTETPFNSELVPLNKIDTAIATLQEKYATVPDASTKEGMQEVKSGIKELTGYRSKADKLRLSITKPHRDFVAEVNAFGKELEERIKTIENPLKDAKRVVDEAEERKKQERIARLRDRLNKEIASYRDSAEGMTPEELTNLIEAASDLSTEDYFDVTNEAEDAKARLVHDLRAKRQQAIEAEEAEQVRRENKARADALAAKEAELAAREAALKPDPVPTPSPEDSVAPAPAQADDAPVWGNYDPAAGSQVQTSWDETFEDLVGCGLDPVLVIAVMNKLVAGQIRHVTFKE